METEIRNDEIALELSAESVLVLNENLKTILEHLFSSVLRDIDELDNLSIVERIKFLDILSKLLINSANTISKINE